AMVSSPSRSGGSLTGGINFAFLYIYYSLEQIHRVLYPLLGGVCSFAPNYRCLLAFKPLVHFKKVCHLLEEVPLDVVNVSIFRVLRIVERHAKHFVVCLPRIEHLKQCYWPRINDAARIRWLIHNHDSIERIVIIIIGSRNEAIFARVV